MVVKQHTLFPDLFSVFYNLINTYVDDPLSRNTQWIFSQFPDVDIAEGKVKYPIIIVDPADCSWENLTVTKKWNMIDLRFIAFSMQMSQADSLLAEIYSNLDSRALNLKYEEGLDFLSLTGTGTGFDQRGGLNIHSRYATYSVQQAFKSGISKSTKSNTIISGSVVS